MKPKKNRARPAVLSAALILLGVLIVGSTVAYLLDRTGTITNRFVAGDIKIFVMETTANPTGTEPGIKKNVKIKNIGELPVRVRAKLVITWKNEAGEVWAELPEKDEDFVLEFADGEPGKDWIELGELVYLYYPGVLESGVPTKALIKSCRPIGNRAPEGYHLSVDILAQAIQAYPLSEISSYLTPETTTAEGEE